MKENLTVDEKIKRAEKLNRKGLKYIARYYDYDHKGNLKPSAIKAGRVNTK